MFTTSLLALPFAAALLVPGARPAPSSSPAVRALSHVVAARAFRQTAPLTPEFTVQMAGITASKPEDIKGQIAGLRFELEFTAPATSPGGTSAGKAKAGSVVFTKRWDGATPKIFLAMAKGTHISKVMFTFYQTPSGAAGIDHTITLTDVVVVGLKHTTATFDINDSTQKTQTEDVSLSYTTIQYEDKGTKTVTGWDFIHNVPF